MTTWKPNPYYWRGMRNPLMLAWDAYISCGLTLTVFRDGCGRWGCRWSSLGPVELDAMNREDAFREAVSRLREFIGEAWSVLAPAPARLLAKGQRKDKVTA